MLTASLPARAQTVLAGAQARHAVRCGSVARPGLAQAAPGGTAWSGMFVDICRALAAAALGDGAQAEYHGYVTDADFTRVQRGEDDVAFLTGGEINRQGLGGALLPGPAVFVERNAVMVPGDARERHLADLAGTGICFFIGASAERSLEAWFEQHHLAWLRHPYSEDGEMTDAYAAQRCHALAGESTRLAQQRRSRSPPGGPGRMLPEALNAFPIIAATGTRDPLWAAVVAWTVDTLISAEDPASRWYAGGAAAMPVTASELGLAPGWQARALAVTGNYGAIFARHLGPATPYGLERGPNAGLPLGGALPAPYVE